MQDAAEKISVASMSTPLELIPYTIFGIPFPGAVNNDPFDFAHGQILTEIQ